MNKNLKKLKLKDRVSTEAELYVDVANNKFYKIYRNCDSIDLIERNIRFLFKNRLGSPKIVELLYDGDFLGYAQEYISDSKTFLEGIDDTDITFEHKYKIICEIFSIIRELHKNGIVIGDIHCRNMLYNNDGGYLVDLDEIRFSDKEKYQFTEYYYVQRSYSENFMDTSKNTDNIKATISALSLLYGFDFEGLVIMNSLSTLMAYLELFIGDKNLLEDLKKLFYNDCDDIIYFDDILKKYFSGKVFMK